MYHLFFSLKGDAGESGIFFIIVLQLSFYFLYPIDDEEKQLMFEDKHLFLNNFHFTVYKSENFKIHSIQYL